MLRLLLLNTVLIYYANACIAAPDLEDDGICAGCTLGDETDPRWAAYSLPYSCGGGDVLSFDSWTGFSYTDASTATECRWEVTCANPNARSAYFWNYPSPPNTNCQAAPGPFPELIVVICQPDGTFQYLGDTIGAFICQIP
ncbi:hypothetical protein WR25_10949 [Diploscapter pachys]|uniref:CUB domain-containing protein n=1 Tax=Diploscapter pachys TaxID=2018661 RepID=A0A2A2LY76_9BILA|nr:hypothetical protein WR25_10949 [Diploscapter pachys]